MKKLLTVVGIVLFVTIVFNNNISAQCKSFAKRVCKAELTPYIHDGNYDATNVLTEGEEADMYKTCFAGQEYRIAVCASEPLPPIEFKVIDPKHNVVLYNNKDHNLAKTWDFKLETSQQLRIVIKVPAGSKKSEGEVISGCVSIMFGIKDEGK